MNKIVKLTLSLILLFLASLLILNDSEIYAGANSADDIYQDVNNFDGIVGIYAKNLNTGQTIAYQSDLVFPMASTNKLIVAMAVYKYMYPNASEESKKHYDECVEAMIKFSDNDAVQELLDEIVGSDANVLKMVISDMKLKQTRILDEDSFQTYGYHNVTTAREMGIVMENLVIMNYLDEQKTELLKYELANTIYNDGLPRHIKSKVMHKVGELDQLNCDVGVVDDGNNQILISIYTIDIYGDDHASDFIAKISYKIYKYLCKPELRM